MKMTKLRSLLALLLTAAMLFAALPAAADRNDPVKFTVSTNYDAQNRTAEVLVSIEGEYQAHSLTARLKFDPRYLSVMEMQKLEAMTDCPGDAVTVLNQSGEGEISFGYFCTTQPIEATGRLLSVVFGVSEDCTNDQIIELEINAFSYYPVGGEEEPIAFTAVNGVIVISGSTEPTVPPTVTPEPIAAPTPAPEGMVAGWYFETDPELDGWLTFDEDGDGKNWTWVYGSNNHMEGSGSYYSASWDETALFPDNWAVSPAFELPRGIAYVDFDILGVDPDMYYKEHYAVYVGTEEDIHSMTEVMPETVATNQITTHRLDLSEFSGQTLRLAFRHFNTSDEYMLGLDRVRVFSFPAAFITYVGVYNGTDCVLLGEDAELPVFEDGEGLHYSFTANGQPWDGKNLTEDVTVTVGYEVDMCTVTFVDPITGEVLAVEEVEYNGSVNPPAAPAHEHYTFAGWDADTERICGDVVIHAVYEAERFTVTFTDGFGMVIAEYEVGWGEASPEPEAPVQEDMTFAGWDSDISCITGNITVNAQWLVNHTVEFYDGMGGFIASFEVGEGLASPEPEAPVREGWTFAGWDADISCITGDLTVNAVWKRNYYTVVFTGFITDERIIEHGCDCELPVCDIEGYHYVFRVNGEVWDGTCVTSDLTVRVTLTVNIYTVVFLDYDGTLLDTQRVNYGRPAHAPAVPEREGYNFIGWDADISFITGDTVAIALYEEIVEPQNHPGDVDCNGVVDMSDVSMLFSYLNGATQLAPEGQANADVNGDGMISIMDISAIYGIIANS